MSAIGVQTGNTFYGRKAKYCFPYLTSWVLKHMDYFILSIVAGSYKYLLNLHIKMTKSSLKVGCFI